MYFAKTPKAFTYIYPNCTWNIEPTTQKTVYLTFDDGPCKGVTDIALKLLAQHNAKATFFCVGEQASKNLDLLRQIQEEGHKIGNHTHNHLKGWDTEDQSYLENIEKANQVLKTKLFRPPYGKATRKQLKEIQKDYQIIMWDILSGDFDHKLSTKKMVTNVLNNLSDGSIIVMHDSQKHGEKMLAALPEILEGIVKQGFQLEVIPD